MLVHFFSLKAILKVIVRLACVTRHHLYHIRNHLSHSRCAPSHSLRFILPLRTCFYCYYFFFLLHHYRFFIVSPSGCSHQEHNDVIYDYVCTDCGIICPTDIQRMKNRGGWRQKLTHTHPHTPRERFTDTKGIFKVRLHV